MKVAPSEYRPDIAIPPGATIRETLESLCMSQVTLAERLGRPVAAVNEIMQGRKTVTAETTIGLARVLPYPAEFWLQLERTYQLT
jgi:HTH-type transcriptional regulator/antitoxin HigA